MNSQKTKPLTLSRNFQPQVPLIVHLDGAPSDSCQNPTHKRYYNSTKRSNFVQNRHPRPNDFERKQGGLISNIFLNRLLFTCILWLSCLFVVSSSVHSDELVSAVDNHTSPLWGRAGEQWNPQGRLPDYSYAGYHRGERPLPDRKPDVSVKDFGAIGDGTTDDSAAIKRAVSEAAGKVIRFPPGRYLLTDIIEIQDSGTVLQGAGPEQTVIYVPIPLEKIRPNMGATTSGKPTSRYSWSGGIILAKGNWDKQLLSKVTKSARQGDKILSVNQPQRFKVGDEIRLEMSDDADLSMTSHFYANDPGDVANLKSVRENWLARVVRVDLALQQIEFDRSLRTDVRLIWEPLLYPARTSTEEIGIEHLSFEFPVTPYLGHFTELGYNAIAYKNVRNSWIRDIVVRHADSGIHLSGANTTVTEIVFQSNRQRDEGRNSTGHHAVSLGGTDQLLSKFDIQTKFIHDITVSRGSAGNVVHEGRGEDLNFDHHRYANHANLYTNIDAGVGTNIFRSGGGAKLGRHCGAWTTWWNIRTDHPVQFPEGWATEMINIVGVSSENASLTDIDGRWFEVILPDQLRPADLYQAQLKKRIKEVE